MPCRFGRFGVSFCIGVLGSLALFTNAWSLPGEVLAEQKISDTQGNFTATIDLGDEFGGAAAGLGDLDGAGASAVALAIGTIGDDDGGEDRGAVYILFLNSSGSTLSYQKISDTQGNFTATIDNLDEFGTSVAHLGDLDGAGTSVAALAVGTTGDDDGGTDRGCVYILFLNSSGSVQSYQKISDTQGNFTATFHNADEFGGAVAWLGDLDGAGPSVATLAVGAIGDDDGGTDRGAVYILFLDSTGSVLSYQKISATSGGFTGTLDGLDQFGSSVAWLGDLDGIGPSAGALAVGAVGDDDGGTDRGCVYILFLNSAGSVLSTQKISSTQGNFTATLDNLDEFGGAAAALGDLDAWGPSAAALAVGATGDDDGGSLRGAVHILFLSSAGTVISSQKISDTQGNFLSTLDNGDEFGGAVAALGDLDGNGGAAQTLVSGASFDDDGGSDHGAAYVLFVRGLTVSDTPALPGARRSTLGPATPNPFNPRTTIPFRIEEAGRVVIGIYDVEGRLVRRLVDAWVEPGDHEVRWDGRDEADSPMASGTYFTRMSVNGRMADPARKAVLLK